MKLTKDTDKSVTRSDVRQIVREELDLAFPDWSEKIITKLGEKIDKMYVKLDKFIGDIQTKRTEQKLHAGQHRKITDRLDIVEKKLHIIPVSD